MSQTPSRAGAATPDAGRSSSLARARDVVRDWPRPARLAAGTTAAVVLVLLLVLVLVLALVRRPLPPTDGVETLRGLSADVEVVRDERGVPQVYADTPEDLWRAQGWVTASERFFQMDLRRHVAAGRLAELLGETAVDSDRLARTLGWQRTARAELALVEPETRAALAAYADGVNAYLEERGATEVAVEYTLLAAGGLRYQPEPWSEVDSLAWLKVASWELAGGVDDELDRALAVATLGTAVLDDLYPSTADGAAVTGPVVDQGAVVDGVYEQDAERGGTRNPRRPAPGWATPADRPDAGRTPAVDLGAVRGLLRSTASGLDALPAWVARGAGRGSNAWVVDGTRTASGSPLLADDPHLDVTLPGTWMQVGLHCRTPSPSCPYEVSGSSLPGVPGVVLGHNADVAWGTASLGADVADLFVERVDGDTYRADGRSRPLRTRTEVIEVAGGDDVELQVRSSAHGPLLSDAFGDFAALADGARVERRRATRADGEPQDHALSLRWTGLRPTATADAILALDRAGDWTEFREALSSFSLAPQGFVYADTAGHIGFQAAGRVPVRKSGNDGLVPTAGWRAENDWTPRPVPFDALPRVLDPADGVLVAANQATTGPDYPYLLATQPDPGYRARRVRAVLEAGGPDLTTSAMVALQADDLDPLAAVLVPALLAVDLPGGYPSEGRRLLEGWDGRAGADSAAAAYLNATWRALLEATFRDELPPSLWPDGSARWVAVVERLLADPTSPWWDDLGTDDVREGRDEVLAAALVQARDDLTRLQAVDPDEWRWGRGHTLDLRAQPTGRWDGTVVRRLLDRTGTQVGGTGTAVAATAWDAGRAVDPWRVTTAPSMRMVVDLADLDRSRWVAPAGVSGHPASAHYDDQLAIFADGGTLPWPFTRAAVDEAATDRLRLRSG